MKFRFLITYGIITQLFVFFSDNIITDFVIEIISPQPPKKRNSLETTRINLQRTMQYEKQTGIEIWGGWKNLYQFQDYSSGSLYKQKYSLDNIWGCAFVKTAYLFAYLNTMSVIEEWLAFVSSVGCRNHLCNLRNRFRSLFLVSNTAADKVGRLVEADQFLSVACTKIGTTRIINFTILTSVFISIYIYQ